MVENALETGIDKLFVNIITKKTGIEPSRITNTLQNRDNGLNLCFASYSFYFHLLNFALC